MAASSWGSPAGGAERPRPRPLLGAAPAGPGRADPSRSQPIPAALTLSRHVVGRQPEQHAAPGGAAEAGGCGGEDQGLPGSCRAPAVLHAERLQGRLAGGGAGGEQSLPRAPVLRPALRPGKVIGEPAFKHDMNNCLSFSRKVSPCPYFCVVEAIS